MSTPFLRETLKFCARVSCAPAEPFTIFFFPPDIWVFVFFWDIWVLRDPTFPAKKNKTFVKGSAGAHVTRAQNVRVYLLKTAWTFGLLSGKAQESRLRIVITWFQCRFAFGR